MTEALTDAPPRPPPRPISTRSLAWGLAVACGLALWFVGLRSAGWDWYISETHAHIIYSALVRFREVPLFSYYLNQGSYLIQDPQFPLFSITTPLVLLFGPEGGLRFAGFVWGVLGFWAYFGWARRHVAERGAMFGALSWVLSLGLLWRIAVGNDLFLWFLLLPLLMSLAEDVALRDSPRAAVALGLVTAACLMGPSFHAVAYLLAPGAAVWAITCLAARRPARARAYARPVLLLGLALVVALAASAPRIAAWRAFDMRRVIEKDGTMALVPALESLASPFKTSPAEHVHIAGLAEGYWYGIWESSVALPWIATALALLGLMLRSPREGTRRAFVFACTCVALGLVLTSSDLVWAEIRALAPSFRVSRRFLILSSFGLSVVAAYGYAAVDRRIAARFGPAATRATFLAAVLIIVGSTSSWLSGATRDGLLRPASSPAITRPPVPPLGLPVLVTGKTPGAVAEGKVLANIFHATGNPCPGGSIAGNLCADYTRRIERSPFAYGATALPIVLRATGPVTVAHGSVAAGPIPPGDAVVLALLSSPPLGQQVETVPPGAPVRVSGQYEQLVIENMGSSPIASVRVTPRSPVPRWLWAAWGAVLATALVFVVAPSRRARARITEGRAASAAS